MEIGIRCIRTSTETAKGTPNNTDVGEIQISIHYVGDAFADCAPAQFVRDSHQSQKVIPICSGQRQPVVEAEVVACKGLLQGVRNVWARRRERMIPGNLSPFRV